jgi:predicted secreted protein
MTQTIHTRPGEPVQLDLDAVPTAGYVWSVAELPAGVALVEDAVHPTSEAIGGGAKQTLVFRAESPGSYEVTLSYGRPWETEPERHEVVRIDVA